MTDDRVTRCCCSRLFVLSSCRYEDNDFRSEKRSLCRAAHRDFRLLWLGQLISQAGSTMQVVAINWHISVLTNYNPLALGLVGLSRVVPIIFFSLVGGAVADARDRRKVMLVTQSAMAILAAMLGLLDRSRPARSCGRSICSMRWRPARRRLTIRRGRRLIPSLVPREHLANALSLNSIMFDVATIVGPMLAGVLIGVRDVAIVYWLNAVSFLAVIGALLVMHPAKQEIKPHGLDRCGEGGPALRLSPADRPLHDAARFLRHVLLVGQSAAADLCGADFASGRDRVWAA